ncbi:chemotaxis protein CheY [Desulfocarbo indianensis]|nr:chemotaxis protein CheY [Desulfocarbo indianensis]
MEEHQDKILIVDDQPANVEILGEVLKPHYKRSVALDGDKALKIAAADQPPDLILLDINMPGMDGYEVCRRLKQNQRSKNIPVIFVTALCEVGDETHGFEMGAVDYITKPVSPPVVLARVRTHLALKKARDRLASQNELLEEKVAERTLELQLTRDVTIQSLASLAETRDNETGGHIRRTQNYVRALAENLVTHPNFSHYLDESTVELLHKSAPLHDVGKVGVPDAILLKPGKLTEEEMERMKLHAIYGKEAIERSEKLYKQAGGSSSFLYVAKEIAYTHHEMWDGKGYPQGLKGEDIPISGRLMALADVYDALISRRVYKRPFPHSKAVDIIIQCKGAHFDPDVVTAFEELQEDFRRIALEFADFEEERKLLQQ